MYDLPLEVAIDLYGSNGVQSNLEFEVKHRSIIEEFGRYPHRNIISNRESTNKEVEFLKQSDSGF